MCEGPLTHFNIRNETESCVREDRYRGNELYGEMLREHQDTQMTQNELLPTRYLQYIPYQIGIM